MYERDGNYSYFDYIVEGVDNVVFANGSVGGGYKYVARFSRVLFLIYSAQCDAVHIRPNSCWAKLRLSVCFTFERLNIAR